MIHSTGITVFPQTLEEETKQMCVKLGTHCVTLHVSASVRRATSLFIFRAPSESTV
jgi:hypothetical protein